jgi:hypothetical protein
MPRLTNPTLPERVIDVSDALAAVLAKSGWVPADDSSDLDEFWQEPEPAPTDAPDDDTSVEDDPTDPALAGNL